MNDDNDLTLRELRDDQLNLALLKQEIAAKLPTLERNPRPGSWCVSLNVNGKDYIHWSLPELAKRPIPPQLLVKPLSEPATFTDYWLREDGEIIAVQFGNDDTDQIRYTVLQPQHYGPRLISRLIFGIHEL